MENLNLIRKKTVSMKVLRIIPHRSVLNTNTRKLQQSLHQLLSFKHPKFPWQHRKGFYIHLRDDPSLWWIIRLTADNIEFLIALPEDIVKSFKIKLDNFDQWKQCRIEEVDDFQIPVDNTDLYKMVYRRNDMFSLGFDYREQTTPIADLMRLTNEITEGESITLSIMNKAYDRVKWKKVSDYSWSIWEKGGMVHRRGIDLGRSARVIFNVASKVFNEASKFINDILQAVEKSFMSSTGNNYHNRSKPLLLGDQDRYEILANGGPSNRTKKKMSLPVFKSQIYLTITSEDILRRNLLLRSVETALDTVSGDNSIKPVKINFKSKRALNKLNNWKPADYEYNLISTDEMGKLQQLPPRELQQEFSDKLVANGRIESRVPDTFMSSGILAGTTTIKGEEYPVYIPTDDPDMLFTPRGIMGSPRMGKDQLAINMIVEARRKHGIGAIVPDVIDERSGHRGMADALRDHIPPEDIVDINLGDFDYPPYLGLHSLAGNESNDRIVSNRVSQELTKFLMGDDMENHQTKEYLQEFAKAVSGDLIGIKLLCLSEYYRAEIIRELRQKGRDITALERFHNLSEGRQTAISQPILIRLQQILGDEFLKPIFGQIPNEKIDLGKWMKRGKVVIFRIPSRDLGEEAVKTIVYWIILVAFLTRLKMNASEDKGVFLVMNEPHQFMSKGLAHLCKRILSEGPKYRFSPIIIFHNLSQIEDRSFVQILLSSSLNWHLFKNSNIKSYQELSNYLEPTFTPEEALSETRRFHYIACWLDSSGEYGVPFMVKAPDLVSKRYATMDNSHLSREHSRIYGKPIGQILNQIREREKLIYMEA